MLVYFAASTSGLPGNKENYKLIYDTLKSLHFQVALNWFVAQLLNKTIYHNSDELVRNESHLLNSADYVVAEVSIPSFGVGYQIKQALMQRKPILCLYPDTLDPKKVSDIAAGSISSLIRSEPYNKKNLRQVIQSRLQNIKDSGITKFNFLISPEIENYLEWATEHYKQSRSELLRRSVVKNIIEKDEEYKKNAGAHQSPKSRKKTKR